MFGRAKRFDIAGSDPKDIKKTETPYQKGKPKVPAALPSSGRPTVAGTSRCASDAQSECGSVRSTKSSFATPKPKQCITKKASSCKKEPISTPTPRPVVKSAIKIAIKKLPNDLVTAQEVEIRNKDYTITEYGQQIEELKNEIATLQKKIKENSKSQEYLAEIDNLNKEIENVNINQDGKQTKENSDSGLVSVDYNTVVKALQDEIQALQDSACRLEEELLEKQMELSSMESLICIRDSLCKDLQKKLTEKETALEETNERLEMVNGHHALAMEANESIRREYKQELECLKMKLDEEKQAIQTKCKAEQETLKNKYLEQMKDLRETMEKEKRDCVNELEKKIKQRNEEMEAKLEQVEEIAHEKLRLCEIQYEQRSQSMQEHCAQRQNQVKLLEHEIAQLKYTLTVTNEQKANLQSELNHWRNQHDTTQQEKLSLIAKIDEIEELSKKKSIDHQNERNLLTAEVDKVLNEKQKFELSLSVTRDIVQVLSVRLRESDNELDSLETRLQAMTNSKHSLEDELLTYKTKLNNNLLECNEYKEALVNILKSKAALAKEHNRIMEHNVTLIESLQNVEKEAYRELGNIKEEMVEDVEAIKMESKSQILKLRAEVERKRALIVEATEQAGAAAAAAEHSRFLLQQAARELDRLEAENQLLQRQIHDQQSLAVEVSLLRQENEELTMTVAKQSSLLDKMKRESEQPTPKSPSVHRKTYKVGKENAPILVSPLRERNH